MTNFEKYKDEVLRMLEVSTCETPGVRNGIPVICDSIACDECDLQGEGCIFGFINWLYEDDGKEQNGCENCKYGYKKEDESPCTECSMNYTSKWKRRPKKIRQDEFLEHYPNARMCKDILKICPAEVDIDYKTCETYSECSDCRRSYWIQEVEE